MQRLSLADTGIYVLMFKNIIIRFLKLTILTVLLLCMFALTFYMTFRQFHLLFNHSPFANPFHSIWKTVAMSIGELGYDELFRQPTGGSTEEILSLPFPEISYILWITFVVLMPILFGNLLVQLQLYYIKTSENLTDSLHVHKLFSAIAINNMKLLLGLFQMPSQN